MKRKRWTMGSLFDGSGGFPLAAVMCGIEPVWASEVEPYPIRVTTKRFPNMQHLGDITGIHGNEIEPVDLITFGSPCQSLSIAGKREGIRHEGLGDSKTTQSGLFIEAIRVIREMREETNGKYPTFILWENVPGAFSSSKGEDFRAVLEQIEQIADGKADSIPEPQKKWEQAGAILGERYSIAWRTLDAQFWGVPQRRKRIYLVADFTGQRAGEILFKSKGLQRDFKTCPAARQGVAGGAADCIETASGICLNDQGGSRMDVTNNVTCTLRAEAHHPPCVLESIGFNAKAGSRANGIGYTREKSTTLSAERQDAAVLAVENHPADGRLKLSEDERNHQTVLIGESGFCLQGKGIDCANTAKCYSIERAAFNQGAKAHYSNAIKSDGTAHTLIASGPNAVAAAEPAYSIGNGQTNQSTKKELAKTLDCMHEQQAVLVSYPVGIGYRVRRLTPLECCRLQGFPDCWESELEVENPTEKEMQFWREVFETHRRIIGGKKPKTDKQIKKWLADPYTDSARYKMWGNGIALPTALFVMEQIALPLQKVAVKERKMRHAFTEENKKEMELAADRSGSGTGFVGGLALEQT